MAIPNGRETQPISTKLNKVKIKLAGIACKRLAGGSPKELEKVPKTVFEKLAYTNWK